MKPIKTYIIQHKTTKEVWVADSGKSAWKATGHAKAAWKRSSNNVPDNLRGRCWTEVVSFNDQDEFECVELRPSDPLLLDEIKSVVLEWKRSCEKETTIPFQQVAVNSMEAIEKLIQFVEFKNKINSGKG